MHDFWPAFFAGLAVAAVIAAAAWAWKPLRIRIQDWWARGNAEAAERAAQAESEQLETLRGQVVERARKLGIPMAVSSSSHPLGTPITYADGHTTLFITDYQRYRSAMASRRVDFANTVNREPPTPLNRRDRAWLINWLGEHQEP